MKNKENLALERKVKIYEKEFAKMNGKELINMDTKEFEEKYKTITLYRKYVLDNKMKECNLLLCISVFLIILIVFTSILQCIIVK